MSEPVFPIKTHHIKFPGSHALILDARLDMPVSVNPRAYVLLAHCFTCSKNSIASNRISRGLAAMGFAVLRFDFTGLGGSEGEFANTNFSSNVGDLVAAADYLRANYKAPELLIGHSLGGAAVLIAAGKIPESRAVCTIAAPSRPSHISKHFTATIPEIEEHGEAEVSMAGKSFRIQKQLLDDIAEYDDRHFIRELGRALLIFHSPLDQIVSIDHAQKIYMDAMHPKSFVSLDDADHLITRKEDAEYICTVLEAWVSRFIERNETQDTSVSTTADHGIVVVSETGDGKYQQRIESGNHVLIADEPGDVGGDDTGLEPYELLLASLGACTSMTLRMYAEHKKLSLDHVRVTLRHDKVHARDCEECETREGKIDRIERLIELRGDLSSEQRQRLLEIADKCPVHRTLNSEIQVQTRLKQANQ